MTKKQRRCRYRFRKISDASSVAVPIPCPQGGILSSFMWNCVLNSLLLELRSRVFYVQASVDDLAVLVTGADVICMRGMVQKAISIAANWASQQELQYSSKKKRDCTVH